MKPFLHQVTQMENLVQNLVWSEAVHTTNACMKIEPVFIDNLTTE